MVTLVPPHRSHPLADLIERIQAGGALLPDSPGNVLEVVGILKSYGVVLDAYHRNLTFIAEHQFLMLFPFFKYFNGEVTFAKLLKHWWHDRINYEFAEYCMKAMFWHGAEGLDAYLDSEEFSQGAGAAIRAKLRGNAMMQGLDRLFPEFLPEQVRLLCYYSALGQFWDVMSRMFLELSDRYDRGEIETIPQVVQHVQDGLVAAAADPITYAVEIGDQRYEIIPKSAGLTFLKDTAVPYVEAVFFRSFPFFGTISYNAQAGQISSNQADFNYGALFADPLPVGGGGIPPTLLMQDMTHFLPDALRQVYLQELRGEDDLRVKICLSFQKAMFCVTTAAIRGLMPHPIDTTNPQHQQENLTYLEGWMDKLQDSQVLKMQS
ncbi:CO2 hydration protein [Leptolyngbya sp. FACHB-711]|uniref:CO2 hydration protein n=1 Tax=unclassified Leptolyngbya TaxID=2650499 RepID=UPI00168701AD|nr:CO2 hydration protein [Leptolyngbya sp. FACHB-711]MBD1850187.1 CO2 hydration protein [Cyanobacteria bacterium FACHB-502]MBD2027712.1 CO2 hydration protein [Leptolyngbya sp. FACHB-711]